MASAFDAILALSQGADGDARRSSESAKQRGTQLGMALGQSLRQQDRDERRDLEADRNFQLQEQQMQRDWEMKDALFPLQKKNMELQGLLGAAQLQSANANAQIADIGASRALQQTTYERDEATAYGEYKNSLRHWQSNPMGEPPAPPVFQSDRYNALVDRDYNQATLTPIYKERKEIIFNNAKTEAQAENALLAAGFEPQQMQGVTYGQKLEAAKKVGWEDTSRKADLETDQRIKLATAQGEIRAKQIDASRQAYNRLPQSQRMEADGYMAVYKNPNTFGEQKEQALQNYFEVINRSSSATYTQPSTPMIKTFTDKDGNPVQFKLVNGQWQRN